jgi:hypothetical protein
MRSLSDSRIRGFKGSSGKMIDHIDEGNCRDFSPLRGENKREGV